ncbi:MAG: T9SS type A sorting domain-containing protein [Winogradskyella sp.]|nr:T9SS type A sorting domain-containing protein [Winogradskyella sp.]
MKTLLLFLVCPLFLIAQTQIGQDIDGEAVGDFSGVSVSLSSDGSIIAIGAYVNDGNGDASGHVRVYKNENETWTKIGQDIDGETAGDVSGIRISLSSDGSVVAVGAPANDDNGNSSGHVRIYKNENEIWTQIGQDIDGETANQETGRSLSLSSDGSIIAIGSVGFYGYNSVSIYKNENETWTQIGTDIDGEALNDDSGISVSLSSDGSIIAIGARFNTFSGNQEGYVRIYKNENNTWSQIGNNIYGEANFDYSGISVSLSSDGSIIAIGAPGNDDNGTDSGHVRVYKNVNGTWIQIGNDIDGEATFDNSGISVSLSLDGSIVAIGAYNNNGNGTDSGHVRVYDLSALLSTESFNVDYFSYFPNPVKDVLNLNLNPGLDLKQVNLYNSLGQYLYSTNTTTINTSNLNSGLYFIEVETDQGKSTKKIIKK